MSMRAFAVASVFALALAFSAHAQNVFPPAGGVFPSSGLIGGGGSAVGGPFVKLDGSNTPMTGSLLLSAATTQCNQAYALAFGGDTDTGVVRSAANTLLWCMGGTAAFLMTATTLTAQTNMAVNGSIYVGANHASLSQPDVLPACNTAGGDCGLWLVGTQLASNFGAHGDVTVGAAGIERVGGELFEVQNGSGGTVPDGSNMFFVRWNGDVGFRGTNMTMGNGNPSTVTCPMCTIDPGAGNSLVLKADFVNIGRGGTIGVLTANGTAGSSLVIQPGDNHKVTFIDSSGSSLLSGTLNPSVAAFSITGGRTTPSAITLTGDDTTGVISFQTEGLQQALIDASGKLTTKDILVDNGPSATPIATFKDNGTTEITFGDGGAATFVQPMFLTPSTAALGTCDSTAGGKFRAYKKGAGGTEAVSMCACEEVAGAYGWVALSATGDCT